MPLSKSEIQPSFHSRIILVVCGIIWRGNRILIARRKADSSLEALKWEFPGGKIEFTEDPCRALQREIKEELDFEIEVGDIFGVTSHNYVSDPGETKHVLMLAYRCAHRKGDPAVRDVEDFRWIDPRELTEYDFAAADRPLVEKLRRIYASSPIPPPPAGEDPQTGSDAETRVETLRESVRRFVAERDWEQFHSPKNLSMSITIEAAELMEHFQWETVSESRFAGADPGRLEAISQEVADIAIYVLSLCNSLNLDLSRAIAAKLKLNREKYPLEKYWGKHVAMEEKNGGR